MGMDDDGSVKGRVSSPCAPATQGICCPMEVPAPRWEQTVIPAINIPS